MLEHDLIGRKDKQYRVTRAGRLLIIERQPLPLQTAYIRVFGAAAAALDEMDRLPKHLSLPEIAAARAILARAIDDTEEHTDIV